MEELEEELEVTEDENDVELCGISGLYYDWQLECSPTT